MSVAAFVRQYMVDEAKKNPARATSGIKEFILTQQFPVSLYRTHVKQTHVKQ